ncbi:formylmethanofuran dehydrogenase subunit E family protein [Nesterenkonia sp. YGD6]|uniref:formylmethanofuran dehydrogenase subunit E family protein n=1 Tax=Nesterenkonia sp. YGD6 TaxID=2901231 RepID=UPI001F4CF67E|nr:formylmethanofuran dehydrogenase subunit E family protein [Nesterenkonia sp. YGD6]MCH8562126.1 formylmethanofuran dehydrogenase subunit E family protein [Nesterenkonia sp. YGD6]
MTTPIDDAGEEASHEEREESHWEVPSWLREATELPGFQVLDTRSAQGRIESRAKKVTLADLILFHGHACDGLLRGAYAFAALVLDAFPGGVFDRTDLLVVSKNSPCLGDIAAYLTGGRVRYGTHLLDDSFGVRFVVKQLSTGDAWEVQEEPGFFPPLIADWEAALLDDTLTENGTLSIVEKADLVAVNEAVQWNWVRTALLPSRPSEHYKVRRLRDAALPAPLLEARRTDVANRDVPPSSRFRSPYGERTDLPSPSIPADVPEPWAARYLQGPPAG